MPFVLKFFIISLLLCVGIHGLAYFAEKANKKRMEKVASLKDKE